jgi:hypothetical protein
VKSERGNFDIKKLDEINNVAMVEAMFPKW